MAASDLLASLLSSGAAGYGRSAADRLLEQSPGITERFGRGAFRNWSRHLGQRSKELSAAVLVDEPKLFAADVNVMSASSGTTTG